MTTTDTRPVVSLTKFVPVRALVHHEFYGDGDPTEWATAMLDDAKTQGLLHDYQVLTAMPGEWGLVLLVLTVDLHRVVPITASFTEAREISEGRVSEILRDDASVPWVMSA